MNFIVGLRFVITELLVFNRVEGISGRRTPLVVRLSRRLSPHEIVKITTGLIVPEIDENSQGTSIVVGMAQKVAVFGIFLDIGEVRCTTSV